MTDDGRVGRLRAGWYVVTTAFRADPWRSAASVVATIVTAASMQLLALGMARLLAALLSHDRQRAYELAVLLGLMGTGVIGVAIVRLDLRFRIEEAVARSIDEELMRASANVPTLEFHERPEHLDRVDLVRSQRRSLSGSAAALLENVSTATSLFTTVALLVAVDRRLVGLPLLAVPAIAGAARVRAWQQRMHEQTAERNRLAQHVFELATTGAPAKELRVFGLRGVLRDRFLDVTGSVNRDWDRLALKSLLVTTAGWVVFGLGHIGAIALIAAKAVRGDAAAPDVILVVTLSRSVSEQASNGYNMVGWLFDSLRTVGRYLRITDDAAAASRHVLVDRAPAPDRLVEGIRLDGVGFRYPGTAADVLRGVDLALPAGSTVAVVGDNGAGKSTLVKLLCGLYSPTEGAVRVDGVDLRRIDAAAWRERLSAGFQDFARFELVAREAVGVGSLPFIADEPAVSAALERAAAADVVHVLADGLETQLGRSFEGGVELSGGQWQKLALGRSMMRPSPLLLVLDEPTAALDADTEHALFERYAGAARSVASAAGGITVLVSHRFSTVRMADLIVVVSDGGVAECGSHAELMAAGGLYAELYELQARAYR